MRAHRPRGPNRYELDVHAHAVAIALHRAFEHIADTEFSADRLGGDVFVLVGEGPGPGDNETAADGREVGGEILGNAIDEIILAWIAREVRKG